MAIKLTFEQWAEIRAKVESGEYESISALAREYGISDAAIHMRAKRVSQPGGAWLGFGQRPMSVKDAEGREIIPIQVTPEKKEELRERAIENLRAAKDDGLTQEENDQVLSEMALLAVSDVLAEANAAQVERARRLSDVFQTSMDMVNLLFLTDQEAASLPPERQERRKHAEKLFLPSDMSSMQQALIGLARVSESIQKQLRLALGQSTENLRPGSLRRDAILPTSPFAPEPKPGADVVDIAALGTDELEKLYEAAEIVEGRRKTVPFLVPPGATPPEATTGHAP